jgi:hypothetical protein
LVGRLVRPKKSEVFATWCVDCLEDDRGWFISNLRVS